MRNGCLHRGDNGSPTVPVIVCLRHDRLIISHSPTNMGQFTDRPSTGRFKMELVSELWLEIFDHLLPGTLRHVSLTCHSFRHLAQPLLFRSLTFCPYSIDTASRRFISRPETVEYTERRIQFCSSSRIAYAVRQCTLFPRHIVGAAHSDIAYEVLLDILLDTLPHFTNLQSLFLIFVDLNQSQVLKLCALRNVRHLGLANCTMEHVRSLSLCKLRVADLTIACDNRLRVTASSHGLSIFSPEHLRSASIINPTVLSYFFDTFLGDASQGLMHLRNLTLPCEVEVVLAFSRLLHLVPELAELKFFRTSTNQPQVHRDDQFTLSTFRLPVKPLSKYQGPRQLLPYFVRPGALEHLSLWSTCSMTGDGSMDPIELYDALAGGNELVSVCNKEVLKTVETLELSMTRVNALALDAVCAHFPILRSLYVNVTSPQIEACDSEVHPKLYFLLSVTELCVLDYIGCPVNSPPSPDHPALATLRVRGFYTAPRSHRLYGPSCKAQT